MVGGEAKIAFRWYFDPTIQAGPVTQTPSRSKFGTGVEAVLFMRLYL